MDTEIWVPEGVDETAVAATESERGRLEEDEDESAGKDSSWPRDVDRTELRGAVQKSWVTQKDKHVISNYIFFDLFFLLRLSTLHSPLATRRIG